MELPFETNDIYVTFDRHEEDALHTDTYKLNKDFSKTEVEHDAPYSTDGKPSILLEHSEFIGAKRFLMSMKNPFKLDKEEAVILQKIGYITSIELNKYLADLIDHEKGAKT